MSGVVLDASLAINLCINQPQTLEAVKLWAAFSDHETIVPPIWHSEVANALVKLRRHAVITAEQAVEATEYLEALEVTVADDVELFSPKAIDQLADRVGVPAYDGLYVRLALLRQWPLLTLDGPLKIKAAAAGVRIPLE